jgi:hypothetical protein
MPSLSYPNLKAPEPSEIVTRYTSLAQLLWIATQQKLPLTRVDLFQDLFEGSVPQSEIEQQVAAIGTRDRMYQQLQMSVEKRADMTFGEQWAGMTSGKKFEAITARRKNLTYSTHASCWRWGLEPDGMWRLYCGAKEGVALQTTFSRLEQSLEQALKTEPLLVGKIQYGDYEAIPPFTHDLDHVMYKREVFAFEQEVRILRMDAEHYLNLCSSAWQEKLPPSLSISWNIREGIDCILVSPYADTWFLEAVQAVAGCIDKELGDRVRWSKLRQSPAF